jgi:hypothetical protein
MSNWERLNGIEPAEKSAPDPRLAELIAAAEELADGFGNCECHPAYSCRQMKDPNCRFCEDEASLTRLRDALAAYREAPHA